MTVRELIEALQKCNLDSVAAVWIDTDKNTTGYYVIVDAKSNDDDDTQTDIEIS